MKTTTTKKQTTAKKETTKKLAPIAEETVEIELTEAEKAAIELKKVHGEVYITTVGEIDVVWRKLKRSEYKEAMTTKFSENEDIQYYEKQDFIARQVILFPEDVEKLIENYAGLSDVIATETLIKTGFGITNTRTV